MQRLQSVRHRRYLLPAAKRVDLRRRQRLHQRGDLSGGNLHRWHGRDLLDRPVPHDRRVRPSDRVPGACQQAQRDGVRRRERLHSVRRV
jgi:hypothetical protein